LIDNWYSGIAELSHKNHLYPDIYTKVKKEDMYELKNVQSIYSFKRNLISLINATKADNVELILGNQPILYKDNMSDKEKRVLELPQRF